MIIRKLKGIVFVFLPTSSPLSPLGELTSPDKALAQHMLSVPMSVDFSI